MSNLHPLIYPMAAHVGLSALLYVLLTACRAPTVWGIGRRTDGSAPLAPFEPRISANLSNQFEWPLFFHIIALLNIQQGRVSTTALALAWLFVGGRLLHSSVHILSAQLRWRGLAFMVNFLAVLGMWGQLLLVRP